MPIQFREVISNDEVRDPHLMVNVTRSHDAHISRQRCMAANSEARVYGLKQLYLLSLLS
jgi:hypothetical protein